MPAAWTGYTPGQCTAWVAQNASWVPFLGNLGDAYQWLGRAQANDGHVGRTPYPGAVAVWGQNQGGAKGDGHVAVVTQVNQNGSFQVSEMNWAGGPFHSDTRTVSPNEVAGFIYPPNSAAQASTLASTGVSQQAILADIKLPNPFNLPLPDTIPFPGPNVDLSSPGGEVQSVKNVGGAAAGAAGSALAGALGLGSVNWWRVAFTGASILTIGAGLLLFTRQDIAGALGKVAASVR